MATDIIKLAQAEWQLGPQFNQGGFGSIYETEAADGSPAVIKLVPKAPGASRELLFEPILDRANIVPILDSGEWQNYYVLVMPRADKSLRQYLGETGGVLTGDEALRILIDVAETLANLEQDVVHRDLKPDNVLLYQNRWCLADFGIARYAEATTSPDTHKYAFTPPYAAPEQWRSERATPATDVYAFGVMAFELLQGHRPFSGSNYREQHLNQAPPTLMGCPASIASLVTECLYKAPQARPTAANILARLRVSQRPSSSASAKLQAANHKVVVQAAQAGAAVSAQQSVEEQRTELYSVAKQSFSAILDALTERIREDAPSVAVTREPRLVVRLGDGTLVIDDMKSAPVNCLAAFDKQAGFDVIAYTAITVRKPKDRLGYEGRSHSLWFCDAQHEGVYRWFELAFMLHPFIDESRSVVPFGLPPTSKEAAEAFYPIQSDRQLEWGPAPFDQGQETQFLDRWVEWFAGAVDGTLGHPMQMPEGPRGQYRLPS